MWHHTMIITLIICRTEPEYYDIVSNPIDMLKVQHKLKSEEYDDIEQLAADVDLIVENAKAYYSISIH